MNLLSKFQLPSSSGFELKVSEHLVKMDHLFIELMSDKGFCRTALGLLNMLIDRFIASINFVDLKLVSFSQHICFAI